MKLITLVTFKGLTYWLLDKFLLVLLNHVNFLLLLQFINKTLIMKIKVFNNKIALRKFTLSWEVLLVFHICIIFNWFFFFCLLAPWIRFASKFWVPLKWRILSSFGMKIILLPNILKTIYNFIVIVHHVGVCVWEGQRTTCGSGYCHVCPGWSSGPGLAADTLPAEHHLLSVRPVSLEHFSFSLVLLVTPELWEPAAWSAPLLS